MENTIVLTVKDDDGNTIKTCVGQPATFKFGAVRHLMELLKIDTLEDTAALLSTVYGAWEELTRILSRCFPDMEDADWDDVDMKDLIPAVIGILRISFAQMLTIPQEKH